MSGLCETCLSPGACCNQVSLFGAVGGETLEQAMSHERAEHLAMAAGLPFRPEHYVAGKGWSWWCPRLDPQSGRCTDYHDRPYLCREYAPGLDELCAHYWPADSKV